MLPVGALQHLGRDFQQMVKERRADLFDDWLKRVVASGIEELQSWADGLLTDGVPWAADGSGSSSSAAICALLI